MNQELKTVVIDDYQGIKTKRFKKIHDKRAFLMVETKTHLQMKEID